MTQTYKPKGVCSRQMTVNITDAGIIESVQIVGGCDGNLKGIASLVVGMPAKDAIARMQGITCGHKSTSCPDQLAIALSQAVAQMG